MAISLQNLTDEDKQFLQSQKAQGLDAQTAFANLDTQKKKNADGGFFKTVFGGIKNSAVATAEAFKEGTENTEAQREEIMRLQRSGEISNTKAFGLYSLNALNKLVQPTSQAAFELTAGTGNKVLDNLTVPLQNLFRKMIGEKNIDAFQQKVFEDSGANEKFKELVTKYNNLDPATKATVDNILTSVDSVSTLAGAFGVGTALGKTGQLTKQSITESLGKLKNKFGPAEGTTVKETLNGALNEKVTGMLPKSGSLKDFAQKAVGSMTDKTSIGSFDIRPAENLAEAAVELEKKGFERPFVDFLEKAAPEDQNAFKEMLGLAEKNQGEFKTTTRPIEVPGEDLTKRAETLFEERTNQGKLKDGALKSMPDEPVNIDDTYSKFMADLEEKGIYLEDDPITGPRVVTKDSPFSSAENKLISEVVLKLRKPMTPKKIDLLRQKIFYALNLGKKQSTMGDLGETLLQNLRTNLKKPLDELSQKMGLGYTEAAEKYATYSKALYDFTKLLGYKGFPEDITKQSLRTGEILNRILGNASARPTEIIQPIIDLSSAIGFKGGNPLDQIQFADILENIFGTTQTRGLKGEVNRGVGQALEAIGTAKDVASGNVSGFTEKAIKKIYGVTKENQIKALKNFLEMLGKDKSTLEVPNELAP